MADFFLRLPTLKASNFEALWLTDPILLAWKDLIRFPKHTKIQESGSFFRVGFVLSMTPHLHRAYLVTVCKRKSMTVHTAVSNTLLKTKAFCNCSKMGVKCLLFHDFTNQRIWLYLIHSSLNIVLRSNLGEKLSKSPNKR